MSTYVQAFVLTVAANALTAYALTTPMFARLMKRVGHTRPDMHKPGRPDVPYSGGVPLYIQTMAALALIGVAYAELRLKALLLAATITVAFAIGLVDDLKRLGGLTKTALTILIIVPIVAAYLLWPGDVALGRPIVPILGRLRLTLIYWLLLPLSLAGAANVVNMLDVFNGVMPATTLVASATIASSLLLVYGEAPCILLFAPLIGALLGYLPYNKYPARMLNGDSGSLFVGAYIGAVAMLTRMEFVAMITLIPHILNGALVIASVGGFKEHREMRGRPTFLTPDFRLAATREPTAPISLTRLILAIEGPMSERQVVRRLVALEAVSALLALVSSLLTPAQVYTP